MALLRIEFASQSLQMKTAVMVIIPERACPRADGKWPTLYLLHGLSDDETTWTRRTSIERYVDRVEPGLAVVMPTVHRSFYTDMAHGLPYWTYVSCELPEVMERMLPLSTRREDRFAAGLSMGGYGALKLGLRCPDRFAAVASLSGAVDMAAMTEGEQHSAHDTQFFTDIFGDPETMRGSDNDLMAVAEQLALSGQSLPKVYMACGTEDFLYENNRGFLRAHGEALSIAYEEGPGVHSWDFWDEYIQRVLAWLPIR